MLAGLIGIGLVFAFMLIYYRLPGVVACIALLFYTLINFALFRLIPVTLTLAGIAGFVLSVGMAVDANILIFERTKEELRAGKTLNAAVEAGFNRAWNSIFDSNVSTLMTACILWYFGSSTIKGFALVLIIGVLTSMFTAYHPVPDDAALGGPTAVGRKASYFGVHHGPVRDRPLRAPAGTQGPPVFDIIGRRKWFYIFSLAVTIPGLMFILLTLMPGGRMGLQFSIDYTGGTEWTVHFKNGAPAPADVVQVLAANGIPDAEVRTTTTNGIDYTLIKTAVLSLSESGGVSNGSSPAPDASGAPGASAVASAEPTATPAPPPTAAPASPGPSAAAGVVPGASPAAGTGSGTVVAGSSRRSSQRSRRSSDPSPKRWS